jgi:hypothetical protein
MLLRQILAKMFLAMKIAIVKMENVYAILISSSAKMPVSRMKPAALTRIALTQRFVKNKHV